MLGPSLLKPGSLARISEPAFSSSGLPPQHYGQHLPVLGRDKHVPLLPENFSDGWGNYGYAVAKNGRDHMEDAVDVKSNVGGFEYLAVFDGHGGDQAVTYVKKLLPTVLEKHLKENSDIEQCIYAAFADMEAMLTDVLLEQAEAAVPACNAELTSGTTACVVLRRGPEAFVANLGDSRAVVSKGGGSLQKRLTLTGLAIWGFQPLKKDSPSGVLKPVLV